MNKKHLFVAEADKIQDLLFRSSKLREVAGGSQMLAEFCDEVRQFGESLGGEIIISAGGSFRIRFDSDEKAKELGEYLSELYRSELGGTITVAELVKVNVNSEMEAINTAQEYLRKAKHCGKPPMSVEHIPYTAICASCGTGFARYYKKRFEGEKENYLCEVCEKKAKARVKERFLSKFITHIDNGLQSEPPEDVDEIAKLESRNYVAYIVADVNNTGKIFSSCDSFEKLKKLSIALDNVIIESLAEPSKILMQNQKDIIIERCKNSNLIPVLPLILAGDDVFALLPARWGLDFTLRFSQEFESRMKKSLAEISIDSSIQPTISSALIICKGNFPYLIAHNIGEELLKISKKMAKEKTSSAISFKVLTGNEIVKTPEKEKKFVAGFSAYTIEELKKLIDYRLKLKDLPGTRRTQLETLFQKAEELQKQSGKTAHERMKSEWIPERTSILDRLEKNGQRNTVNDALIELGYPKSEGSWIMHKNVYYHKLPDLLRAWDFACDLEKDVSKYKVVEK